MSSNVFCAVMCTSTVLLCIRERGHTASKSAWTMSLKYGDSSEVGALTLKPAASWHSAKHTWHPHARQCYFDPLLPT